MSLADAQRARAAARNLATERHMPDSVRNNLAKPARLGDDPVMLGCGAALVAVALATIAVFARRGEPVEDLVIMGVGVGLVVAIGIFGMWAMRKRQAELIGQRALWRNIGDVFPFPACVVDPSGSDA